jgi:hypothetical protein
MYPQQGMAESIDIDAARRILGDRVLGPEEIERAFGAGEFPDAGRVPFPAAELEAARAAGEYLVLRTPQAAGAPLTLLALIERFPDAFNARFLRQMGYQLKTDWGIALEPLAATESCRAQWALVRAEPLDASRNASHEEQEGLLLEYAAGRRRVRRRTAIEVAFDLLAFHRARGERLLARAWDWTSSRTVDGGFVNLGHFDADGIQVFSYSQGVRHGLLGVCPNTDPQP